MYLLKILSSIILFNMNFIYSKSDIIPLERNEIDQFGCIVDAGYVWCPSSKKCIRTWEEDCDEYSNSENNQFCDYSPDQLCRRVCNSPNCGENQCAIRTDHCCDYTCHDNLIVDGIESCPPCPPHPPCPLIPSSNGCSFPNPIIDSCGCQVSCGIIDCSSRLSESGEECNSYMSRECAEGLDCINIMGPIIADSPGICRPKCEFERDSWGNCIDRGCNLWFDGCNTCRLIDNHIIRCTEKMCHSNKGPKCLNDNIHIPEIPLNCEIWFDGCNTCSINNGKIQLCTMMACFTTNEPYCKTFTNDILIEGDICYRFCEDNSQNTINRINQCPEGTICSSSSINNIITIDNCGGNSLKCIPIGH